MFYFSSTKWNVRKQPKNHRTPQSDIMPYLAMKMQIFVRFVNPWRERVWNGYEGDDICK